MKPPTTHQIIDTAVENLLTPYQLSLKNIPNIFEKFYNRNLDDADIYFQYSCSESWNLDEGMVKAASFNLDKGFGIRAVTGEKTAFAYSDEISERALLSAPDTVKTISSLGLARQTPILKKETESFKSLYVATNPITSLTSTDKVALLTKIDLLAKKMDARVIQVMASLGSMYEVVLIAKFDGSIVADVRPLVRLNVSVLVEQNGRRELGNTGGGGRLGLEIFDDATVESYVKEAVKLACANLEAKPAPAGEMTVVLGPGWPGILLHEAVGHGLEGDFNRKGSSAFTGRIGQRIVAKGVTVIDNGTLPNKRGSLTVDDEGNQTQENVLIEDGILKSYMQDSLNARLSKVALTGNGRRESFAHLPMPRMTNTYMLEGDYCPEEIIASVEKGVYATHFGGGQVDITTGRFVFSADQAWWIENGKLQYPLKGATLIGNGPESLKFISMIGNNLQIDSGLGTCGKDGQSVPVGVGQPTIKIDKMTVGGTML